MIVMKIGKHNNKKEEHLEVNKVKDNTRRRMQDWRKTTMESTRGRGGGGPEG